MDRTALKTYILDTYHAGVDHPWAKYPGYEVFRHPASGKWFALMMDIPKSKLGLPGDEMMDVVNLKCDPVMLGSLLGEPGFFPAYHMNKTSWITAALDGSVEEDKLQFLLERSFDLTNRTPKRKNRPTEG